MRYLPGPKLKAGILFAAVALIVILLGSLMAPVIIPLLLSSILYVLLEPLVSGLQRRGMNRVPAILVVLGGLLIVASLLSIAAAPALARQLGLLRQRLPEAWEEVSAFITRAEHWMAASLGVERQGSLVMDRMTGILESWPGQAVGVISGWIALLAVWVITVPLVGFFLLRDYRSLRNMVISLTPNRYFEVVLGIYHRVAFQLMTYFRGVMVQSGVMAVITTTGFWIVGLPMAPILGVIAGILNIIPYLGPMLGIAAPLLVAMTAGSGVDVYLGILGVVLVAQLVDNIFVIPSVIARAANIHPLMALLGVIVAGSFFGLMGMVFAIPVLSSTRIVYRGLLVGVERHPLH